MKGQLPSPFSDDPQQGPAVRPLPPILRATKPGTWAHDTVSRRLREEILTAGRRRAHQPALPASAAQWLRGTARSAHVERPHPAAIHLLHLVERAVVRIRVLLLSAHHGGGGVFRDPLGPVPHPEAASGDHLDGHFCSVCRASVQPVQRAGDTGAGGGGGGVQDVSANIAGRQPDGSVAVAGGQRQQRRRHDCCARGPVFPDG
eukprot:ctg_327.g165